MNLERNTENSHHLLYVQERIRGQAGGASSEVALKRTGMDSGDLRLVISLFPAGSSLDWLGQEVGRVGVQ